MTTSSRRKLRRKKSKNWRANRRKIYLRIYNRFWGWMHVEGRKPHGWEIHHIVPIKHGGKDNAENLIALCPEHHELIHRVIYKDRGRRENENQRNC
jgi:5-methylcytosine-specific restriction endonuclease McrA